MIGFGAIGRGTMPLIERHFQFDPTKVTVIDPCNRNFHLIQDRKYSIIHDGLTPTNYRKMLDKIVQPGTFVVNLSVDVSSAAIIDYCRERGAVYMDTVVEPWKDGYDDHNTPSASRSNYVMREEVMELKAKHPRGPTAITCCGANPGMVSWLMKDALLDIARDTGVAVPGAEDPGTVLTRAEWAQLAQTLGVKGVHIAERDTQQTLRRLPRHIFTNTWSCDGLIAEGFFQPTELGWGTHEKWFPSIARRHQGGCQAAIYFEQPGGVTPVRSWCPTLGAHRAYCITHNESISIADYYTILDPKKPAGDAATKANPLYRPTAHYAYHMSEETIGCIHDMISSNTVPKHREVVYDDNTQDGGFDELGVFVYGHKKNAYWLGSKLKMEEARALAPWQNATALQVSSAALAGIVYALRNPMEGIIEADEMEHKQCLAVQKPYLGLVSGHYTDWTPLQDNFVEKMFKDMRKGKTDPSDPWQFKNVLVHYNN